MGNTKLKLFRINLDLTNLEKVLEKYIGLTCAYPVKANEFVNQVHGLTLLEETNPHLKIYQEILDIEKENNFELSVLDFERTVLNFNRIYDYIEVVHKKFKDLNSYKRETEDIVRKYKNALIQVRNIENLDISLDELFSCEYVNSRFGRMPLDSLEKLIYYKNKPFIFQVFQEEKKYCWCMYLSTDKDEREIDDIFSGLFFERINIPDFVHGTPEDAQDTLLEEIKVSEKNLKEVNEEIQREIESKRDELSKIKGELLFIKRINDAKKYIVGLGDRFIINGFVRTKNVSTMKAQFEGIEGVELTFLPANSDKRLSPPTKLK